MKTKTVYIIDNDVEFLSNTKRTLKNNAIDSHVFSSSFAFFEWVDYNAIPENTCILAEMKLSDISGMQILDILDADNVNIPTIMMTIGGNISMVVEAMQQGAAHFIEKPFNDKQLINTLDKALAYKQTTPVDSELVTLRQRISSLSPRQKEVLQCVFEGMLNKNIAQNLGISIKTVETHRANLMEKMKAHSTAELVRLAARCDFSAYGT